MKNQGLYERRALPPNSNEGFTEDLLKDVTRLTALPDSFVRAEFDRCLALGLSVNGALRVILADASGFGCPETLLRERESAGAQSDHEAPASGESPPRTAAAETRTLSAGTA